MGGERGRLGGVCSSLAGEEHLLSVFEPLLSAHRCPVWLGELRKQLNGLLMMLLILSMITSSTMMLVCVLNLSNVRFDVCGFIFSTFSTNEIALFQCLSLFLYVPIQTG